MILITILVMLFVSYATATDREKWITNQFETFSQWWNVTNHGNPNETWSSRVARETRDENGNYTKGNWYLKMWVVILGTKHLDWASSPDGE